MVCEAILRRSMWLPLVLVALWGAIVIAGLALLSQKANTPGTTAAPPRYWAGRSAVHLDSGRATLVMFVHPQCPCSRASVEELNALMAHRSRQIEAYVLFLQPEGVNPDWVRTDLWRSAAAIPGVRTVADEGGREAARFGARTSGQTLVYGPGGDLLFSGGITGARGHVGDNAGREAIESITETDTRRPKATTPVFGCSLF
jgi:hypothetical protein